MFQQQQGDLVTRVTAVDGDKLNKRLIRYGLLAESNPFVAFFDLDPMSGKYTYSLSVVISRRGGVSAW